MEIKNILPLPHIILPLEAADAAGALNQLIKPLVDGGIVTDPEKFFADIWRREQQITTQVECGVAFPHARSDVVKRLALTMGVAPEPGIVFNPQATERCRIFFLIAIPTFAPAAHLPLLQRLVVYVHDAGRRERLLESRTAGQVTKSLYGFKGKNC